MLGLATYPVAANSFALAVLRKAVWQQVGGLAADPIALRGKNAPERRLNGGPFGQHGLAVEGADVVDVDVDRKPVEVEMEDVERGPAF